MTATETPLPADMFIAAMFILSALVFVGFCIAQYVGARQERER